jgi:hypothetical protein
LIYVLGITLLYIFMKFMMLWNLWCYEIYDVMKFILFLNIYSNSKINKIY